jgi:hypothetical protein
MVTFMADRVVAVNVTTIGFAYLFLVLIIASVWGFIEAAFASVLATLVFNFFFFRRSASSQSQTPRIGSRCSAFSQQRSLQAACQRGPKAERWKPLSGSGTWSICMRSAEPCS